MWPDKGHNPIMALEPEQKWAKKKKKGEARKILMRVQGVRS